MRLACPPCLQTCPPCYPSTCKVPPCFASGYCLTALFNCCRNCWFLSKRFSSSLYRTQNCAASFAEITKILYDMNARGFQRALYHLNLFFVAYHIWWTARSMERSIFLLLKKSKSSPRCIPGPIWTLLRPSEKEKKIKSFFCRVGKSTFICAIELAVQHMCVA